MITTPIANPDIDRAELIIDARYEMPDSMLLTMADLDQVLALPQFQNKSLHECIEITSKALRGACRNYKGFEARWKEIETRKAMHAMHEVCAVLLLLLEADGMDAAPICPKSFIQFSNELANLASHVNEPELDDDEIEAEYERMNHGERPATVKGSTATPWTKALGTYWGKARAAGAGEGKIESATQKTARLKVCGTWIGHPITSSRDMSADELLSCARALEAGEITGCWELSEWAVLPMNAQHVAA